MANKNRYANEILLLIEWKHLTGDQMHKLLKKTYPFVGIGTVYRNLNQLVEEGVLMKTAGVFDQILYETQKPHHGHIICRQSKNVYDIDISKLDINALDFPKEFTPEQVSIAVEGLFVAQGESCSAKVKGQKV